MVAFGGKERGGISRQGEGCTSASPEQEGDIAKAGRSFGPLAHELHCSFRGESRARLESRIRTLLVVAGLGLSEKWPLKWRTLGFKFMGQNFRLAGAVNFKEISGRPGRDR